MRLSPRWALVSVGSLLVGACTSDPAGPDTDPPPAPAGDISVQVAFDANNAAFRFKWKSRPKLLPAGGGNVGQVYPMQFHDILKSDGTKFDRLPAGTTMDEDRVSFMLQTTGGVAGFNQAGCFVACHTGMSNHRLVTSGTLDHWHWRGGRSGPMGYAEDAAVSQVERIRDGLGTSVSKWLRSGGDRLREDQAALTATGHPGAEGMPRFVFKKGAALPGGYVVPGFFLAGESGAIMTDPYTQIPQVKKVDANRSLLVVAQDLGFDPIDKRNALDVGYLVFVAKATTNHLPSHLRSPSSGDFVAWRDYWAQQSGIQAGDVAGAEARLSAIRAEWEGAGRNAMVTRSVGTIYRSDQHDIASAREFDPATGTWTVTMIRKLTTGSSTDADLSGFKTGQGTFIGIAVHDAGGGSETHNITLPYSVGAGTGFDIAATSVSDVKTVDWSAVPAFRTNPVKSEHKVTRDWLRGTGHGGAAFVEVVRCQSCHKTDGGAPILNP